MKILITGYTTRMWGSQRIQGDYVTFTFLLEQILKDMGHQVIRRKINAGEELPYIYDYIFCGLNPLSSMSSGMVPQTHWAMSTMPGRHCVYADDWSFCGYGDSVRYALDRWEKYLVYKNNFQTAPQFLEGTRESLYNMMAMENPLSNAPVLCPMFNWGDHDILMKDNYKANLVYVDPSAWLKYPTVDVPRYDQKVKHWVMAALSDHSRWVNKQGFQFPVTYCGNKRKNTVFSESETVRLFASSFGVLASGYPSAGCGWWRTRYLNAAWAESLIYTDPRDAAVMGNAYFGTPHDFEILAGTRAYRERVNEQISWLTDNIMPKDEVIEIIGKLIAK